MIKELTEKWKNGKLDNGMYYIRTDKGVSISKLSKYNRFYNTPYGNGYEANKKVEEVLAPVPSYDEFQRLQEQLKEANEVIRYYDIKEPKYVVDGVLMGKDPAHIYCVKWGVK